MEMGKRIGQLIKDMGISKAQFAKTVGTSASRVSNITTGRNKPDSPMLEKLAKSYPEVNTRWLLTGKGTPFLKDNASSSAPVQAPDKVVASQDMIFMKQQVEYLHRENELLKTFVQDLRQLIPLLQAEKSTREEA